MNPTVYWYLARASGMVAWWLLWAAVVWGLVLSMRLGRPRLTAPWVLDLHRFLGGTAVVFVALHVTGLLLDRSVSFGPAAVLVPLAATWRPGPVALGVVAMYLLIAVELTSLARRWLPHRWWRRVHQTSFLLFGAVGVHAFAAGTDHGNVAVQWSAIAMAAVIVGLTAYRAVAAPPGRDRGPAAAGADRRDRALVVAGRSLPERQE